MVKTLDSHVVVQAVDLVAGNDTGQMRVCPRPREEHGGEGMAEWPTPPSRVLYLVPSLCLLSLSADCMQKQEQNKK